MVLMGVKFYASRHVCIHLPAFEYKHRDDRRLVIYSTLEPEAVQYRSKHDNVDGNDVIQGRDGESSLEMRLVSFKFQPLSQMKVARVMTVHLVQMRRS